MIEPFVARDREIAELTGGFDAARDGRGRLFLVVGGPGTGKTRLVEELARRTAGAGARALWGRCWEAGGAPAYWPWVQILRPLVRDYASEDLAARAGSGAPWLAQLLPEVRVKLPETPDPPQLDAQASRFALFDAVTTFLAEAATDKPLCIVVDDLHAADQPSIVLLRFVARELVRMRALVVVTYRELEAKRRQEVADALVSLGGEGTRIDLHGFGRDDVLAYLRALTQREPDQDVVERIDERTEGNPLFVREVARLMLAEGEPRPHIAAMASIPESVRDVIRARLAPLSREARDILAVAAVIGREFDLPALQRAAKMPGPAVLETLSDAVGMGVIAETGRLARYGFTHTLIRDTLYDDLSPVERLRLHGDVAEALEEVYAEAIEPHVAELAHHAIQSGIAAGYERALAYCERAAQRALRMFAFEEAAEHDERALEVLRFVENATDDRRCELMVEAGEAWNRAARVQRAHELFVQAAVLAEETERPDLLARAALEYGWIRYTVTVSAGLGFTVDATHVDLLERALAALPDDALAVRIRLMGSLAQALYWSENPDRRLSLSAGAIEAARALGDGETLAQALTDRHQAAFSPDLLDERLAGATEVIEIATVLGDDEVLLRGLSMRITDLLELGDVERLDADIEAHRRVAASRRFPQFVWEVPLIASAMALLEGRFEEAERSADEAMAIGDRAGLLDAALFRQGAFGLVLPIMQERLSDTRASLAFLISVSPPWLKVMWEQTVALIEAQAGNVDTARALVTKHDEGWRKSFHWFNHGQLIALLQRAEVATLLQDRERAGSAYEDLLPYASHVIPIGRKVGACLGSTARGLGRVATLLERWDDAERHFDTALEVNTRLRSRPWIAHTKRDHAAMLLARGTDRAGATRMLQEAVAIGRSLAGMETFVANTVRLASEHGIGSVEIGAERVEVRAPSGGKRTAVFHREGDYWTVGSDGSLFRLRDAKGFRYIAELLARPHVEVHALDLASARGDRTASAADAAGAGLGTEGDTGELLDAGARATLRKRVEDLEEEAREAEEWNDPERARRARDEIQAVADELAKGVGLGGRARRPGSAAERARVNVTKAIASAVAKIAAVDPSLGHHLDTTIKTGTFCVYEPDPAAPLNWRF